jgi:hypothetical protein
MTTIHLDDQVAASLTTQASALGMTLEDYLKSLTSAPKVDSQRLTAAEVIARIQSVAVPSDSTYRGTYPREDIYSDHD